MKRVRFLIAVSLSLPALVVAQNSEIIRFDQADSTDGYYLAVRPQSNQVKGALVLLTSFTPPESILPETKLHNVAYVNDLLTVVASTKQKLYADSSAVNRINLILKDVISRFSVEKSSIVLAGYDEAGNIALRYVEYTYEHPNQFPAAPKAVFAIDTHVDLFGLWHWSERQIKKNYWPGSVGDARYYLDTMTKENGNIYTNSARYKELSPFSREDTAMGNERFLKDVALRLYYDTDIDWQLKNRRNSLYDTKFPDGSELINRLLLLGNNSAEFISSDVPGRRSNGQRHPNALSVVDEVDCIEWIKKCLDIFDARTWIPPYQLKIPDGWDVERFSLPPDFAPGIKFKGVEDLRFAPGWGNAKSENYWTYCFLWWLKGNARIDPDILEVSLKEYYDGLVGRNIISRKIPSNKLVPTVVDLKKIKTAAGDLETYAGTVSMLDYQAQQPIVLNCSIHWKDSKSDDKTVAYFELSPRPLTHAIWKKLDEVGESFRLK